MDNVGIGQLIKSNRQQFPLHTHCIQKCVEACICICMLRKLAVDAKAISVQFDYKFLLFIQHLSTKLQGFILFLKLLRRSSISPKRKLDMLSILECFDADTSI